MAPFTSSRELRLWLGTLAVVAAIYSTIGLSGQLADALRGAGLLPAAFALGILLVGAAIIAEGLRSRPRGAEIAVALAVALAVAAGYFMVVVRMGLEERTHLIEYSVVALLLHAALSERADGGGRVPAPALLAVLGTALVGVLDELIQGLLPSRVFDPQDILFNVLAGLLAVVAIVALRWARGRAETGGQAP